MCPKEMSSKFFCISVNMSMSYIVSILLFLFFSVGISTVSEHCHQLVEQRHKQFVCSNRPAVSCGIENSQVAENETSPC